jgi:hypothetical protein
MNSTMELWSHKKISCPEAPVRSGVISRTSNGKRSRGRLNLTLEESVKRDLKNWSITKELELDRSHNLNLRFLCYYLLMLVFSFILFTRCFSVFYCLFLLFGLVFLLSFFILFHLCFCLCYDFISSLPNLLETKMVGCYC